MKRGEVIERLKQGDTLIYDDSIWFGGCQFKQCGLTVRYDTALNLIRDGLVNQETSKTAHGISYLTWHKQK